MLDYAAFAKKLLQWSSNNPRNYPWIGEKDPYKIWISEIILQQTRSEQALAYYLHFISIFPDVSSLAKSTEDQVLNAWKGLGYYSRARNLYATAQQILKDHHGNFPTEYDQLLKLKGIGPYSAAAISSFAFNKDHAVVDGNVVRLLSRIYGIRKLLSNSANKIYYQKLADQLLLKDHAAVYNQAIMNFGALHCTPLKPQCSSCPFQLECYAYTKNAIDQFPPKKKKNILKKRYLHFFIYTNQHGEFPIRQRKENDIWKLLYEFPLLETQTNQAFKSPSKTLSKKLQLAFTPKTKITQFASKTQKLSHQELHIRYYQLKHCKMLPKIKGSFSFVKPENLVNFAFPKAADPLLESIKL